MENKEYLNEERYQKNKKKLITVALIVLIVGVLSGVGLIATGIVKSLNVKTTENVRTKEVIKSEIDDLNSELVTLQAQMSKEFTNNGLSEEYYRLSNEVSSKKKQVSELETELWKVESGYNRVQGSIAKSEFIPFYMFGGFIIIASCMVSGSIYMFAKRREMIAFTTQQVMPVAKEGIEEMLPMAKEGLEKMTPTFKDAAKEITKGIKEGLNDDNDNL